MLVVGSKSLRKKVVRRFHVNVRGHERYLTQTMQDALLAEAVLAEMTAAVAADRDESIHPFVELYVGLRNDLYTDKPLKP